VSHTPGPWMEGMGGGIIGREDYEYAKKHGVNLGGSSKYRVAEVYGLTWERVQANASLIAAAPDMLAALEYVCEAEWDGVYEAPWITQAMAAIKKAKGQ
jgi:hypothetical protein